MSFTNMNQILARNCKLKQRLIKHIFSYIFFLQKFFKSIIFVKFFFKMAFSLFSIHDRIVDNKIKVVGNWILPTRTNFCAQKCASKSIFYVKIFFGRYFLDHFFDHQFLSNCPENQFQLGKNSSLRDFKFFTIDLVMVNNEKSIKNHPLTQEVLVRPV